MSIRNSLVAFACTALLLAGCSSGTSTADTDATTDEAATTEATETAAETTEATDEAVDAAADENPTPPWADDLKEGEFISTTSSCPMGEHLDLFDEHTYTNPDTETHTIEYSTPGPNNEGMITGTLDVQVGDLTYYVYDPTAHGADPEGTYPVLLWFHGSGNALSGNFAISAAGAEYFATDEWQAKFGPAYIICPLANEFADENGSTMMNWISHESGVNTSVYSSALKGLVDEFMTEHEGHTGKLAVVGTSAGGYMAYHYALDYVDTVNALLLMAPAYTPTEEELDTLEEAGFPILHLKSLHDEMLTYEEYTAPVRDKLDSMANVTNICTEWAKNGDGGVSSLFYGIEMGQHCICASVGQDMMFDDGTPMEEQIPAGVTGWFKEVLS